MEANIVEKRAPMAHRDIIKYQLITQCYLEGIQTSESELNCLTLLGALGESELAIFCNAAVSEEIFKTSQTVRNFLTKAEKEKLVIKKGTSRKKVILNPDLQIQTEGNIVLDYKFVHVAS